MSGERQRGGKTLDRLTADAERFAESVQSLADRLKREGEDAASLLLTPLAGIDPAEAKRAFQSAAKGIGIYDRESGEYFKVASGRTLATFIRNFGRSYEDVPASTRTVETFWSDPAGCSVKTRRAALIGVLTAIDGAIGAADETTSRLLSATKGDITNWVDAHFMTEARVAERTAEAERRIELILSVADVLSRVDETSAAAVAKFARFARSDGGDIASFYERYNTLWDI